MGFDDQELASSFPPDESPMSAIGEEQVFVDPDDDEDCRAGLVEFDGPDDDE
jgi:hypothetical protein